MRYFLECAFRGTQYHGWQRQPEASSVQQSLEDALRLLLSDPIEITGAGRTDTGVHAHQMFAHFDTDIPFDSDDLSHRLNRFLPADIVVRGIHAVHADAHARFDATSRKYRYWVVQEKDPFKTDWAHLIHLPLDLRAMNKACIHLLGKQDFECFSKSKTDVKTYFCEVKAAGWTKEGNTLVFNIEADRFLRNMVRAVVGTLLEVGLGKREVEGMPELIRSKSRSEAGVSVPAKGLSLIEIQYPYPIG